MTPGERGSKRILIVEDDSHIRRYLETLLQDDGYQTITAADGNDALEKLQSAQPDLICLDIGLPEKSGVRLYREIRNNPDLPFIPVVIVTGITGYGGDAATFKRFLEERSQFPPPEAFIAKPIEREGFLATIKETLAA